jgi:hypothetical protein
VLYEESIPDSRQEVRALQSIMGTLNRWADLSIDGSVSCRWFVPAVHHGHTQQVGRLLCTSYDYSDVWRLLLLIRHCNPSWARSTGG